MTIGNEQTGMDQTGIAHRTREDVQVEVGQTCGRGRRGGCFQVDGNVVQTWSTHLLCRDELERHDGDPWPMMRCNIPPELSGDRRARRQGPITLHFHRGDLTTS